MIKSLIVSGAVASAAAALASPALADVYVNPEFNGGVYGDDYLGGTLNLDVGYEVSDGPYSFYIQGGPSWLQPDAGDTEVGFSAKTGVSAPVAEPLDVYGEVSYAKYKDADAGYGLKAGLKYNF